MKRQSLLQTKLQRLTRLLSAGSILFNELDRGRYLLRIEGCKVEDWNTVLEFDSRRALHAYLNEKIKLFSYRLSEGKSMNSSGYKLYIKKSDQMWHVLFWDGYGGRYGWHRDDDMWSANGFLLKKEADEWATKRLRIKEVSG